MKDYFIVAKSVLQSKDVSLKAKGLYAILMMDDNLENLKEYTTNTYDREIEELTGLGLISESGVLLELKEKVVYTPLKEKELVVKVPQEKRRKYFINELTPFKKTPENPKGYPKDMLNEFYLYWSEASGPETKMLFEKKSTWDLSLRLSRWSKNDKGEETPTTAEIKTPDYS